jgi:ankyrin repeat protein
MDAMENILAAIVEDDRGAVEGLLAKDRTLAQGLVRKPRLYEAGILHWLYAGDTALHLAAAGYRVEIVRTLLAAGADPNAAGNHRQSRPLHYAADGQSTGPMWDGQRQVATIRVLVEAGAEIEAQDRNGATPLHRAVRTRCAAAVGWLLGAGADPLRKNKPGSTPFHLAVQNSGRGGSGAAAAIGAQREIIEEFLAFGVSPMLKSGNGKTVRDCARSAWIEELLDEGAATRDQTRKPRGKRAQ